MASTNPLLLNHVTSSMESRYSQSVLPGQLQVSTVRIGSYDRSTLCHEMDRGPSFRPRIKLESRWSLIPSDKCFQWLTQGLPIVPLLPPGIINNPEVAIKLSCYSFANDTKIAGGHGEILVPADLDTIWTRTSRWGCRF